MSSLIELALRCEKATGPDRELDRDIIFGIYPKDRVAIFDGVKHISTMTGRDGEPWFLPLADRDDCPRFTGSTDAAMTLVPDLHTFNIYGQKTGFIARVFPADIMKATWREIPEETKVAATATLALCSAAIRAIDGARG